VRLTGVDQTGVDAVVIRIRRHGHGLLYQGIWNNRATDRIRRFDILLPSFRRTLSMSAIQIPSDPFARFKAVYDALNRNKSWMTGAASLRFAAMAAVTCPGDPVGVAEAIQRMAQEIKEKSGWFGQLNSPLRFILSAMLVMQGDDAGSFLAEVERARSLFRARQLRRGGIYETMAILILRLQRDRAPIEESAVARFQQIYEVMKKYHWWLTGPDDFPACAILVGQPGSPDHIGARIEQIYQALDRRGFSKGDPLQTAANLLYLARIDPDTAAARFRDLAAGFKGKKVAIWQSDYDELAILSFLDHPADVVVPPVLENRRGMEGLKPKPDGFVTFNLAAGVTFLELARRDMQRTGVVDAKALLDMQAVINAQQAAAAAACSAAAASAAATG